MLGLNAALMPIGRGHAEFSTRTAKFLAGLSLVPRVFACGASNRSAAERLLRDTGSAVDRAASSRTPGCSATPATWPRRSA